MSLSVFNPSSSSSLSPFHLQLCLCFKAISLVAILPQEEQNKRKGTRDKGKVCLALCACTQKPA